MLIETFRKNGAGPIYALQNEGYERGALHLYPDQSGSVIYAALRMDHPGGGKKVLPIRATRTIGCNPNLEVKALDPPRPLYGLDVLANRPDAAVLIVEGEKAADAGRHIFTDAAVITWPGGAPGITQVDFRPLTGREITIWPDNDRVGRDAAEALAGLLEQIGAAKVRIVQVPPHFPPKWDLADPVPELACA